MTPLEEKLYLGAIPDTKIEELVDTQKLSDERIEQELRNNTASKDYIFVRMREELVCIFGNALRRVSSKGKDTECTFSLFLLDVNSLEDVHI